MSFLIIIAEYHNKYFEEYHCHLGHTDIIPYNYGYPTYLLGGYVCSRTLSLRLHVSYAQPASCL